MPLLRQTLYAQNVNLYLAPTADGRDSWLSLMRTVGIEGRCFVVSSNMCVPAEGSTSSKITTPPTRLPTGNVSGSAISEEDETTSAPPPTTRQRRRKSVFDDNGNEIVLCCPEDAGEDAQRKADKAPTGNVSKTAPSSWISRGGSCIVSPFGDVLSGPQWEDPQSLIYTDVDFRDCVRGRLDFDAAGSYSRNDSFKFSVNGLDLEPLPY